MPRKSVRLKIRVLIVDDHPMVREGIHALIDRQADMIACGESEGGADALQKVEELRPDLATVDINLRHQNGLELVGQLRSLASTLRVLVLSTHEEDHYRERAAAAGAHGYVTKWTATRTLVPTIRKIMFCRSSQRRNQKSVPSRSTNLRPPSPRRRMPKIVSLFRAAAATV
jgi:DNA-binding NarL/FixJ family response regulator